MPAEAKEKAVEIVTSWSLKGRREGVLLLVLDQLTVKLGSIDDQLEERIQQLEDNDLQQLGTALLAFSQVTDLENWLDQHST